MIKSFYLSASHSSTHKSSALQYISGAFVILFLMLMLNGCSSEPIVLPGSIKKPTQEIVPELPATSTPEAEPIPEPAPAANQALPEPTPPAPAPEESPLTWLIEHQESWPDEIVLKEQEKFDLMLDGQVAGSVTVPAGAPVQLVGIKSEAVTVSFNGGTKQLPITATDLPTFALQAKAAAETAAKAPPVPDSSQGMQQAAQPILPPEKIVEEASFGTSSSTLGQTEVRSLKQLKTYLAQDDVNIKMKPGTYVFDTDNCGKGKLFSDPALILITGSNCIYDFTGVKFEFNTEIFRQYGRQEVIEFQLVGKNNVVKNLTMEDIGDTVPIKTALCMSLDGEDNRIEGFTATTRGSSPYGYGDIFGKGRGSKIGLNKHGGCQFRGINNHLKNCKFYLHTYGHGIFIQGAKNALVEGCHVEGELRTTDEVLAEEGTGSAADQLDFITTWGFRLQPGGTFSLQEDGIRCYKTGIIYGTDGESTETKNTRVIDSTVKFMRTGVTIGWDRGKKYVENCTAIGTESGFWVGSDGEVINCRGDTSVGPLYSEDVRSSRTSVELTFMDNIVPKYGETPAIYIAGSNHEFTLRDETTSPDPEIKILVGGTRLGHRWQVDSTQNPPYFEASDITINNLTDYPVILGKNSSNITGRSKGKVTDEGSDNKLR